MGKDSGDCRYALGKHRAFLTKKSRALRSIPQGASQKWLVPLASLFAPEKFHFSARLFKKSGGSPRGKGLPPFPSYKENTYSAEVQIALTLRNSSSIVKMRRFAADGGWRVLSYEAGMEGLASIRATGDAA